MKTNLMLLAMIAFTLHSNAQDTKKVFGSPTIVWYGVDFTQAKLIDFGEESPHKIQEECFKPWNDMTIDLDMGKIFQKNAAYKDPNGILKEDLARETSNLKDSKETELTPEMIADRVKSIPQGQKKDGLAVVFIVESFNKTSSAATVHVVFFDIKTREVLWSKKLSGKAGGGNTCKAWTAALKDIFNQIEKKEYKAWKIEANY